MIMDNLCWMELEMGSRRGCPPIVVELGIFRNSRPPSVLLIYKVLWSKGHCMIEGDRRGVCLCHLNMKRAYSSTCTLVGISSLLSTHAMGILHTITIELP